MSATDGHTRHDADVTARLAAWHATATAEPEHVERQLRKLAGALVTFSATAGVDIVGRGHDDPLHTAVRELFLDAFRRGLGQGRGERPETFLGFLQFLLRRATPEQAGVLLDLLEGAAAPGA